MQTTGLISIIIIVVTLLTSMRGFRDSDFFTRMEFEVDNILIKRQYYRFFSSSLVHVNWSHLLFNMISLFFFAFSLEGYLGPLRFLPLYLLSTAGGNLLGLAMHRKDGGYSAVGSSAPINGIIFAAIMLFPGMHVFFMPGWLFGLLFVGYSVYGIRSGRDNIGHESHLGGALAGMLLAFAFKPGDVLANSYVFLLLFLPTCLLIWLVARYPRFLMVDNYWFNHHYNYTVDDRYNMDRKAHQKELDRILDKINQKGLGSLSRKERATLDEFSRK